MPATTEALESDQPDAPASKLPPGARKYWLLSPALENGLASVRAPQLAACAEGDESRRSGGDDDGHGKGRSGLPGRAASRRTSVIFMCSS